MNTPTVVPGVYTDAMQGPKGFALKPDIAAQLEPTWARPLSRNSVRVVASLDDEKWRDP